MYAEVLMRKETTPDTTQPLPLLGLLLT